MKVQTTLARTGVKSSVHTWDIQNPAVLLALQGAILVLAAMVTNMGQKNAAGLGGASAGGRSTLSFGYTVTGDDGTVMFDQKPSTWHNLAASDVTAITAAVAAVFKDFDASAVKTKV